MFDKLESLVDHHKELEQELSRPDVFEDQERYRKLTKAHADLGEIVEAYREYQEVESELADNRELAHDEDPEIREMARAEVEQGKKRLAELEDRLQVLLLPTDPLDEKNIILEIRAGTGGDEAALFAADLFRMYTRFAELQGWKVEMMSESDTGTGGYKEVIALISGDQVYSRLKYESGTHRVQRVPATESQGRIHTSAVTVAILPEAEDVDVEIDPSDLRVDVYRASGAGGQHVNTTDSAVRITHLPTNTVVTCQDEKSQHKNRAKAMKVLKSRILQAQEEARAAEEAASRREQVGTGDRSGRIRTYNFPQGRITDHRINLTLYKIDEILAGNMDHLIDPLISHHQAEALQEQSF
jgi:peptide chain release factor 1